MLDFFLAAVSFFHCVGLCPLSQTLTVTLFWTLQGGLMSLSAADPSEHQLISGSEKPPKTAAGFIYSFRAAVLNRWSADLESTQGGLHHHSQQK